MKTLFKVPYEPVFVDEIPSFIERGKVYISEKYKTSKHICLCGCDEMVIMPISGGQFWDMIKEPNGTVSFIGSVGNYNFPCKSHYIMTKNVANFI